MKTVFHIGYPKTATSWLQKKYFPYISNACYVGRRDTFESFIIPSQFEFNPTAIREKIAHCNKEYQIFSLESFVGTNHNFGMRGYLTTQQAYRIHSVFPNSKIILFIRNQADIIASSYLQYVAGGGTNSIKKYLYHKNIKEIAGLTLFSWEYFEYHHVINLYQGLFGDQNVYVFLFEDFVCNKLNFVQRFSQIMDFKIEFKNIELLKVNPSYRRIIHLLALIANRFTERKMMNKYFILHIPGWFEFSGRSLRYLNQFRIFGKNLGSKDILSQRILYDINNFYKQSNSILVNKYNLVELLEYSYSV